MRWLEMRMPHLPAWKSCECQLNQGQAGAVTKPQKILLHKVAACGVMPFIMAKESVTARALMRCGLIELDDGSFRLTNAGREALAKLKQ